MGLTAGEGISCGLSSERRLSEHASPAVGRLAHLPPVLHASLPGTKGKLPGARKRLSGIRYSTPSLRRAEDFVENADGGDCIWSPEAGSFFVPHRPNWRCWSTRPTRCRQNTLPTSHVDKATIDDILSRWGGVIILSNTRAVRAKDGSVRTCKSHSNARPHCDEVINTRCLTVDVTDASGRRTAAPAGPATCANVRARGHRIAEVDGDGKLQRVNAHLASLLGHSSDELLGRSIFDPVD